MLVCLFEGWSEPYLHKLLLSWLHTTIVGSKGEAGVFLLLTLRQFCTLALRPFTIDLLVVDEPNGECHSLSYENLTKVNGICNILKLYLGDGYVGMQFNEVFRSLLHLHRYYCFSSTKCHLLLSLVSDG